MLSPLFISLSCKNVFRGFHPTTANDLASMAGIVVLLLSPCGISLLLQVSNVSVAFLIGYC